MQTVTGADSGFNLSGYNAGVSASTGSMMPSNSALAGIGYGFSAITAALGAFSQSSAQKQAYQYQSQISKVNEQIAQWDASAALNRGQTLEGESRLATAQVYSSQRASMAANGVDITEGSPVGVLATTKFIGNVDAATIHDNALQEAWGYQVAGVNASNASSYYSSAASNINPGLSAGTSLLTSAGSVASNWYTAKSAGVFN